MNINDKIKCYMKDRGISVKSVSGKLNMSSNELWRRLRNKNMKVSLVINISEVLGVNNGYFFEDDVVSDEIKERHTSFETSVYNCI